jgi:hypothetical protein
LIESLKGWKFRKWTKNHHQQKNEIPIFKINDIQGNLLSDLEGSPKPGINKVEWNMRAAPSDQQKLKYGRWARGELQDPREYTVVLEIGGMKFQSRAFIEKRMGWEVSPHPRNLK